MDTTPIRLTTDGLILREWHERDLEQMTELFDDDEIAFFTPLPSPFTLDDAHERLARARQGDRLLLAITTDGEHPLGEVLVTSEGELGYAIGARHRGQGLAARALTLLRDYAHDELGLAVLRLRIEPDNSASAAVAAKAGFRRNPSTSEGVENKGRAYTVETWEHTS